MGNQKKGQRGGSKVKSESERELRNGVRSREKEGGGHPPAQEKPREGGEGGVPIRKSDSILLQTLGTEELLFYSPVSLFARHDPHGSHLPAKGVLALILR